MSNELDIIKPLKDIIDSNNYLIDHIVFRGIIGKIIDANKLNKLKDILENYIKNAPLDFYASHLAIVVLSVYEKYIDKEIASQIAIKIINQSNKPSYALSSLLRICRITKDYSKIDEIFKKKPNLLKLQTFEVLYELTFYYSSKNEIIAIDNIIKILLNNFKGNIPILKTVNALSIKYGLYEKYQSQLSLPKNKFIDDSYKSLINEIEEEEYQKVFRSAALADLTNGIAHEFGQPVTNIRFAIQYYTKLFESANGSNIEKQKVLEIFSDILLQTERIGKLISTLSPITSTKAITSVFNLGDAIRLTFEQEKTKLNSYEIKCHFRFESESYMIEFDFTQFNQIITNLLNNSIDSISEKKISQNDFEGKIWVTLKKVNDKYSIWFKDNGNGIVQADTDRIFNPFYTTKPPDKGTGLGLYIVSNLLKMNGGSISFDSSYKHGAKFIILIPKKNEI